MTKNISDFFSINTTNSHQDCSSNLIISFCFGDECKNDPTNATNTTNSNATYLENIDGIIWYNSTLGQVIFNQTKDFEYEFYMNAQTRGLAFAYTKIHVKFSSGPSCDD